LIILEARVRCRKPIFDFGSLTPHFQGMAPFDSVFFFFVLVDGDALERVDRLL